MTASAVRDAVDPRRLLATATALLEVPSPTGQAGAAADRLAGLLEADGFAVERMAAGHADAPAVITRLSGGSARTDPAVRRPPGHRPPAISPAAAGRRRADR